jgi:protein involved in polysaccharide export with SLBB domain
MELKYFLGLVILSAVLLYSGARGQNIVNPASINVSELSDLQIDQIIQEVQVRGLTEDQAVALARSQGASQAQIDQMQVRIRQRQMSRGGVITTGIIPTQKAGEINRSLLSVKAPIRATDKNKKIFGFSIFNSENLSFEPSVNIPTPKNYPLGIADQVVITVWGASQSHLQLTIDQNGAITIPDVGPVYLSGLTFEKAQALIKNRLMAIYSGMAGQYPNTWAEVSLGGLRSIKVNVLGEINAPGTYTLPSTASAFNALYLSGGPNENGSFREIRLIRDGETIRTIDVYDFLVNGNPESNVQLRDQDIIFVPTSKTMVQIGGQVKREGFFEIKPKEMVKDLIRFAGGFSESAYTQSLSLVRNNEREHEVRDIPEAEFARFTLQNGDQVKVDPILNRFSNRVSVSGAILHPGNFELTEGMRLSDLLKKADGLREDAFMNRGLISRLKEDHTSENITFDLNDVMSGKNDILLKKEDQVTIRSIFEMREEQKVSIVGEVLNPQPFEYRENMTLSDLIFRAGGFREDADISYVELARRLSYEEASRVTNKITEIHQFALTRDLKLSPADAAFRLQPFDEVYVRRAPGFRDQGTVMVTGEVTYAGTYSISDKSERVSDVIRRAGGLVPGAYTKGATLTRTSELSPVEIEKKKQLVRDSMFKEPLLPDKQSYLVGIELDKILADPGNNIDLLLQPGDLINIPKELQTVKVSGSVLNPLALTYENHLSLRRYIDLAGGYTKKAQKSKTYVIYPNGTSASTRGFIFRTVPKVSPGSEIIVPEKPEKKGGDDTMKWISIAGLTSSLAVSIVTLVNLVK